MLWNGRRLLEQRSLAEPLEASEPRPCSETGQPGLSLLGSEASPRGGDPPASLGPSVQLLQRRESRAGDAKQMMLGWEEAGWEEGAGRCIHEAIIFMA